MTSSIIKKVLWLGATLALGLLIVQASPAAAASSCKSGYEKVKGKCVKKCKKGYGRRIALAASASGVQSALPSRMSQSAKLSFSRCRNSGCSALEIANGVC